MSERLESLRWGDVSKYGITPASPFSHASNHVGRVADVSADVAPSETGTDEHWRKTGRSPWSGGEAYEKGRVRCEPSDSDPAANSDPTADSTSEMGVDPTRENGSENAQIPGSNETNPQTVQSESLAQEPTSTGVEKVIIEKEGVALGGEQRHERKLAPRKTKSEGTPPVAAKKERKSAKAELQELGTALAGMKILVAEDTPILQVSPYDMVGSSRYG